MIFTPSPTWKTTYPGASAGVLAIQAANQPQHPALEQRRAELQAWLRQTYAGQSRAGLLALPSLAAYQSYYRAFNKTYHVQLQLESILTKGRSIPSLSVLVTSMFMAELKNLLLTAGHDLDSLQPPVRLDVASGSERYTLLNTQAQTLKPGDMYMADQQGVISSILYGPDHRTRITPTTRRALYTVYAPPGIPAQAVRDHLADIEANVRLGAPDAVTEMLEVFGTG